MASWGDIGYGRHRPTLPQPTRSAILGLVASTLGYGRDEDGLHAALATGIGVAVCTEIPGQPLRDYHTAQAPGRDRSRLRATRRDELAEPRHTLNTILSTREYVTDALYIVALWKRTPEGPTLDAIAAALERPVYAPFLGRRSCPTIWPLTPLLVEAATLAEALAAAPVGQVLTPEGRLYGSALRVPWGPREASDREVHTDEHEAMGAEIQTMRHVEQRDAPESRSRRVFATRVVHVGRLPPRGG